MDQLLDALQDRGVPMAVLSNKPHEFTCLCVERLLSRWKFGAVLGAVEGMPRKPDPAGLLRVLEQLDLQPGRTLYLGDTAIDMKTALGGGCYPVGALWGFRDASELRDAGARTLIAEPGELLALMSSAGVPG
jgi:phosphoglycolate phosphatase